MNMMELKNYSREGLKKLSAHLMYSGSYASVYVDKFASTYGHKVRVVRGRKVPHGTEGVCFWMGIKRYVNHGNDYGCGYGEDVRIGIRDVLGQVYWTSIRNIEVLEGSKNELEDDDFEREIKAQIAKLPKATYFHEFNPHDKNRPELQAIRSKLEATCREYDAIKAKSEDCWLRIYAHDRGQRVFLQSEYERLEAMWDEYEDAARAVDERKKTEEHEYSLLLRKLRKQQGE